MSQMGHFRKSALAVVLCHEERSPAMAEHIEDGYAVRTTAWNSLLRAVAMRSRRALLQGWPAGSALGNPPAGLLVFTEGVFDLPKDVCRS